MGHALYEASVEASKPDGERETAYRQRNAPFMVKRLAKRLTDVHPPHEAALLRRAVASGVLKLPLGLLPADGEAIEALATQLEDGTITTGSIATMDAAELASVIEGTTPPPLDDVGVATAKKLYAAYVADRDATKALLSERDQLLARLLELQQEAAPADGEKFYPDANSCLRLSAGHLEGYRASDAVTHTPVTTLNGLVEKHLESAAKGESAASVDPITGEDDYAAPARLVKLCAEGGKGGKGDVGSTPCCVCYSTDTVGGNSGSPVLDADGKFIAINFDRQRLGLMNEFKWSIDYARSIGTDVRYILFLVGEVGRATEAGRRMLLTLTRLVHRASAVL